MHQLTSLAVLISLAVCAPAKAQSESQTSDAIKGTLRRDWAELATLDRKDRKYDYTTVFHHQPEGDMRARRGMVAWSGGMVKVTMRGGNGELAQARNERYEFAVVKDKPGDGPWQLGRVTQRPSGLGYEDSELFSHVIYQSILPLSTILGAPAEKLLNAEDLAFTGPTKNPQDQWIIDAVNKVDKTRNGANKKIRYEFQIDPANRKCVLGTKMFVDDRLFQASRRTVTGSGDAIACTSISYELWGTDGTKVTDIVTTFTTPVYRRSDDAKEFYLEAYGINSQPSTAAPVRVGLWQYALGAGALLVIVCVIARASWARR